MISIEDLRFRYAKGEFALDIPALAIELGERVAVIVPSGPGKTSDLGIAA